MRKEHLLTKHSIFEIIVVALSAIIVTFLVSREIFLTTVVFSDNPFVVLSSGSVIEQYLFTAWHPSAFGESYLYPLGNVFLILFLRIASFFNNIDIFNFLYNLCFPLGFVSFYFLSQKISKSIWIRLLASAFYMINPVTIAQFIEGGIFRTVFVFLPLSLYFFLDTLQKPQLRTMLKAGIFTSLSIFVYPSLTLALFIVLSIITLTFLSMNSKDYIKKILPVLLIFGLILFVSNSSFFYMTNIYHQSSYASVNENVVLADFKYCYQDANIPNLLRLVGNAGSSDASLGYNDYSNFINYFAYIIPLLAFSSILWIKKDKEKDRILISLLASAIFIIFFILFLKYLATSDQSWIILNNMFLWTMRNPLKLQVMLAPCLILPFSFSFEKISFSLRKSLKNKNIKIAALALILLTLGIAQIYYYNSSAFNGYLSWDKNFKDKNILPDPTLKEIVLNSQTYPNETFRGIILPFDHYSELHVEFTNPLLLTCRFGTDSNTQQLISNWLESGLNPSYLFSILGIKYVYTIFAATHFLNYGNIIQCNASNVAESLRNANIDEQFYGNFSRFTIDTALPPLYLSSFPLFYSDLTPHKSINSSIFSLNPVFFELNDTGPVVITPNGSSPLFLESYSWDMPPIQGSYDLYAIIEGQKTEVPIVYSTNGIDINNLSILPSTEPLQKIASLELNAGPNRLMLGINDTISFKNIIGAFIGSGSSNIQDNLIKVENGTLYSSEEFSNFDLSLDFKPIKFGSNNWNGPDIYLSSNISNYVRLLFHTNGLFEIAKNTSDGYEPNIIVKATNASLNDWNHLRILKSNDSITLYLNNELLLNYYDSAINKVGKIGIGSDQSITTYQNVNINRHIINSVLILPSEKIIPQQISILESTPTGYRIQFTNENTSWRVLLLGEDFDPGWTAKMDGVILTDHEEGNLYANCWFFNATQGTHEIELNFTPNNTFQPLIYADFLFIVVLMILAYVPFDKLVFHYNRILSFLEKKQSTPSEAKL